VAGDDPRLCCPLSEQDVLSPMIAMMMRVFAALGLVALLAGPSVAGAYGAAEQNDNDVPAYVLKILPDGHSLSLVGGIRFGLASDLSSALKASPGIRTIYLTSPGGRLGAAQEAANFISRNGLNTYVLDECSSACTRVFVAGKRRTLLNGARLGFHSANFTSPMPLPGAMRWIANRVSIGEYVSAGIDPQFMERAVSIAPKDIWYPSAGELLAAHVITGVTDGLDFALTGLERAKWYGKDSDGGYPASQRILHETHGN